jgi:aminopeptidase C
MVEDEASDEKIKLKIDEQMVIVYRIIGICIGIPCSKFTWEYIDKTKQYHSVGPLTASQFYQEYVKPVYNVDDKVRKINVELYSIRVLSLFSAYREDETKFFFESLVGGIPF